MTLNYKINTANEFLVYELCKIDVSHSLYIERLKTKNKVWNYEANYHNLCKLGVKMQELRMDPRLKNLHLTQGSFLPSGIIRLQSEDFGQI